MRLLKRIEKSNVELEWNWPLEIGSIKELIDEEELEIFNRKYWLNKLAHSFSISRVRNKCNILFLFGTFDAIKASLKKYEFNIKADFLVILLDSGSKMPRNYKQKVKKLQNLEYNSFYISVVPSDKEPFFWLDELIFNLSHNHSIDKAIELIFWSDGKLISTKEILDEGKVDVVFGKMIDDIAKSVNYTDYEFDDVFNTDIRNHIDWFSGQTIERGDKDEIPDETPDEILNKTRSNKEKFTYDRESDESSLIKEISTRHSSNLSDMLPEFGSRGIKKENASKSSVRFLQCIFVNHKNKPSHHGLLKGRPYSLKVKIDVSDHDWLQGGDITNEDISFKSGKPEQVKIILRYRDRIDQENISVPSIGASTEAIYKIKIKEIGETHFEIFAFHKTRLIQHVGISAFFCDSKEEIRNIPKMKMKVISMPRRVLNDLQEKKQYGLSLVFTDGLPIMATETKIEEIRNEDHMNEFNRMLTKRIEKYVKDLNPNPDIDELFLSLAKLGRNLFINLFKCENIFDKPIQIISSRSKHIPIEFVYTKKLNRKATKLCPKAFQAVKAGKCKGCINGTEKYICPLGFVALRTIIERHQIGVNIDKLKNGSIGLNSDVTMDRPAIPILQQTLYGTSERVDSVQAGLRKRLGKKIKAYSEKSKEVHNWNDWSKGIKKNPDSLVIVGHVETKDYSKQLEIGTDLLDQAHLDSEFISGSKTGQNPFVILIGCNTQDVEMSFMDFANHFKNQGAAIVLSSFTKIQGRQAVPLVEKLLEILYEKKGARSFRFGKAMLDFRRKMFSDGLYVSMALVAHGDADWKLKI